jgi:hypothetical protein
MRFSLDLRGQLLLTLSGILPVSMLDLEHLKAMIRQVSIPVVLWFDFGESKL